ncbi:MAG: hypothetical protein WHT46_02525 [Candidatus Geothermincolales bacterium]
MAGENEKLATEGEVGPARFPEGLQGIDVPSLMEEIRERARRKVEAGLYPERELSDLEERRTAGGDFQAAMDPLHELVFVTDIARQYAQVTSHYPIGARKGPVGWVFLLAKKVIRRFMTPYMDAVFQKQREFNAQVVKSLDLFAEMIKRERERNYHGGMDRYTAWVELGLAEEDIPGLDEALQAFPEGEEIVELYPGRGEFLERAARSGRRAYGVEQDPRLIRICQQKGLKVLEVDPLDYLEGQEADSLSAVFVRELGERNELKHLLFLVGALGSRMERGGKVVVLNHHPHSLLGTEEAYRDPSVLRLVHPDTLAALFRQSGFEEVSVSPLGEFDPERRRHWEERLSGAGLELAGVADCLFAPRRYLLVARR